MNRRITGSCYEKIAAAYLKENCGYKILEMNYRCRFGEIDIIAMDSNHLIFVEVKYRANLDKGHPLEAIDLAKQKKIYKVAQYYMIENNFMANTFICRFDAISFQGENITHIKNAFGSI